MDYDYIDKKSYTRTDLDLDTEQVRKLEELNITRSWIDLLFLYFQVIILVFLSLKLTQISYLFYPLLVFFIAGRQGAFLQLIHEASHKLISKNIKLNDFYGKWLTSYIIGVNYQGYKSGHNSHHSNTATENDPVSDSEKYAIVDFKDPKIYLLFVKDLFGFTSLKIFFNYGNELKKVNPSSFGKKIFNLFKMSIIQLIILSLFGFDIFLYFLFWLYPAMGPHMFLMRIRGIAEHGLAKQLNYHVTKTSEGRYFTRSFLTNVNKYKITPLIWIEKLLIGSFFVYYHHEHHLNANIPYYNLNKFHNLLKNKVNNYVKAPIYEKGYFSAALRTVLVQKEELY